MKVLFLITGWQVASSRYRVLQYIPYLESKGVKAKVILYPRSLRENWSFFKSLYHYDIIFCQRKRFHTWRLWLLRKRANKIIFDFDDAIMYRSSNYSNHYSLMRMKKFRNMMKRVDGVIAGNTYLKNEASKFISPENIFIIPTIVDMQEYSIKDYNVANKDFIIGWIGTSGNLHYLKSITPALEKLNKKYKNIKLKIVCDSFFDLDNIEVIKKIWRPEDVEEDLKSFDVGVMPIADDLWTRGKCGLKVVQYLAAGVPAVVSPVGLNRDLAIPGETGLWADDIDVWTNQLSELIDNPDKRMEMGLAGRKLVEEKYSLQAQAPRYLAILRKIAGENIETNEMQSYF